MDSLHSKSTLRRFNDVLTVVVILLALYVILAPLLPQVTFWVREKSPVKAWASEGREVYDQAVAQPAGDRLFIPSLGLSEVIHEGGVEKLKYGVVRRGHTSTPDNDGNTVLVGHRFMYDVRGVFYHLDKVKPGDDIYIHWNEKKYTYTVTDTFVVAPEEISIEGKTDASVLTIYTCTPLWTAKDRLVVRATLQGVE